MKPKRLSTYVARVAHIDLALLHAAGIKGIILDLDNTIVSEDDRYLAPGAEDWIRQAQQAGMALFLLSNGKRKYRVVYWSTRLGIAALSPARKPFPVGFRKALRAIGCCSHQVVVVGDSFHTDGLGAWLTGCPFIQVASLPHPPRWWERLAGRWLQKPYRQVDELWPFDITRYQ